jgi:hypothetical protein
MARVSYIEPQNAPPGVKEIYDKVLNALPVILSAAKNLNGACGPIRLASGCPTYLHHGL